MMERLQQAVDLIRKVGYDTIAERLAREKQALSAESYRIAVVGEFKTGKSTLINRVFLKEDLLFTDIMEATAVVTEIQYGSEKRLEVIPYATRAADPSDSFEADSFE
ncbi:MAG: dynamin family protein, partial [Thermodesulfobacteriota bacterium]